MRSGWVSECVKSGPSLSTPRLDFEDRHPDFEAEAELHWPSMARLCRNFPSGVCKGYHCPGRHAGPAGFNMFDSERED
jgi:hypothetical protein